MTPQSKNISETGTDKLGEPASKVALNQNENPSAQEINTLVTLFSEGRYAETAALAQAMTARFPLHGFAWKVLGAAFKQMGRSKDALVPMQKAASLSSNDAQVHVNLGITLQELGYLVEAESCYRRALQVKPDYAQAYSNLGETLQELGRLKEAEVCYRRAIQVKPDYAQAHCNLGTVLNDLGHPNDAESCYRQALQIKPDYVQACCNLGTTLNDLGRIDEAEAAYRRAIQLKPDYARAHTNLGAVLNDLGRLEEAKLCHLRALQIKSDLAEAHNNLGFTLKEMGRLEEAEASYRLALQIRPDYTQAHSNLGFCLLMMGRLSEAWTEYEYRWDGSKPKRPRPATTLPQWIGQQPADGDHLLVFEEQGLGDRLQFSRYLPLAADRFAGRVSLVADTSMRNLFRRSFPDVEILDSIPFEQSAWQWQCPLLSLPLAFRTTLENVPGQAPYLVPDPARVAYWQARVAELGFSAFIRKIGVVWKKGKRMKNNAMYSLTLQHLAPLLSLPDCAWFSLQKDPDPDKKPWVAAGRLVDWTDEFGDFDETAALAMNLDLIITVDTSVAHLAGGLGRPTWLFNRHSSDWRWMRDREDSPWYPTVRIFTQKKAGEWDEVVTRMAAVLAQKSPR